MGNESATFTMDDIRSFISTYREHERNLLADRLDAVSRRLETLAPRVERGRSRAEGWTAHEVLAHIAVVSKFYGVLAHRIASGKLDSFDLLEGVHLRDTADEHMAALDPGEVLSAAITDQRRTSEMLRHADVDALRRAASFNDGMSMTAEEVARLPLVAHLEEHVAQLERALEAEAVEPSR